MPATRFAALLSVLGIAALTTAHGQEANDKYYNIKAGPIYVTLSSGLSTQYTDNVNLSNGRTVPLQSDLLINPNFGIDAISEMQLLPSSETNTSTLGLTMNFGYQDHVFQPQLNQNIVDLNINPDSELSFVIHTGHFKTRIHDGFSLQSDPTSDPTLSNVAEFRRFTNTFGVDTQWDVNSKTVVNFGYSHRNLYALDLISLGTSGTTTNLNTSDYNNSSDGFTFSAASKIVSCLNLGANASVEATTYPADPTQDSTTYAYGPFSELRLSEYTSLNTACGVTTNQPGNVFTGSTSGNSTNGTTSDYFNASLVNRMNTYYNQTFSVGRQTTLSLLGQQTQIDYVRYTSSWNINSTITLASGVSVEDTTDLSTPATLSHFRTYSCDFGTGFRLSKKLTTNITYRYINKIADDPNQSYKQNTITWNFDYRF
jgi:hypothetical protein